MRNLILAALLASVFPSVFADTASDLESRLKAQYPNTQFTAVRESAVKGIYEVVLGRNVAYTNDEGRYLIFGHLFDMKTQKDLTAAVIEESNKVKVSALLTENAIKTVRGSGARKLYIFTDPDCPYCKKLEVELAKIDNVTIYTFMYPLESLHPDAKRKSRAIWCATDKLKAWESFMLAGQDVPKNDSCDNPVEQNVRLGESLGFRGTPTIIFADGLSVAGAMPSTEIERRLQAVKE